MAPHLYLDRIIKIIGFVSALILLSACGGDDGDGDDETSERTVLGFTSMPATGQTISPGGETLYEITGLTPGILYNVSIAGSNHFQLNVLDDPNFSSILCNSFASTGSGNCSASPSGTSLFLRVKDTFGLGDTFTLDVTIPAPIVLGFTSMPATGQTLSAGGEKLFEITGLTPGVLFNVSIAGSNDKRIDVSDDAQFLLNLCGSLFSSVSSNCSAAPSGTSLFLRVRDTSGSGDTFTLGVTVAAPIVLDFASMPATGQAVPPGGETLFEIAGLTPGILYTVSIAGNHSTQFHVFDNIVFSEFLCRSFTSAGSGSCSTSPSGTSLFLRAKDASGFGENFTLDVTVATPTMLDIASMPAIGQTVLPWGEALFEITGLAPGTLYTISMIGNHFGHFGVFDDPALINQLCGFGDPTGRGNCNAKPSSASLFLRLQDSSGLGDTFTLDVIEVPWTVLDIAGMPATVQTLPPSGDALFEITGLNPGSSYTVSVAGTNSYQAFVYDDSSISISNFLCGMGVSTDGGSCNAIPSGSSLFLWVPGRAGLGGILTLDVIATSS